MFYTGGGQYLDFVTGTGRLFVDAPFTVTVPL